MSQVQSVRRSEAVAAAPTIRTTRKASAAPSTINRRREFTLVPRPARRLGAARPIRICPALAMPARTSCTVRASATGTCPSTRRYRLAWARAAICSSAPKATTCGTTRNSLGYDTAARFDATGAQVNGTFRPTTPPGRRASSPSASGFSSDRLHQPLDGVRHGLDGNVEAVLACGRGGYWADGRYIYALQRLDCPRPGRSSQRLKNW